MDGNASPQQATAQTMSTAETADQALVNRLTLSTDEVESFRQKGYIKLRGLLTEEGAAALRAAAKKEIFAATDIGDTYGTTFKRLSYNLQETDIVKAIYSSSRFRNVVGTLTGTRLIITQALGFELSREREGFPWHYGSLTFRYIRPQDMGYTIWFPLDPVDIEKQDGGLALMPQNIFSCQGNYQLSSLLSAKLLKGESIADISEGLFKVYDQSSILMREIMEEHKEEFNYDVGDALVFNKNVWHRSSPLKEGPLDTRLAVNIRMLDWRARLDMTMYHGESETSGGVGMGADWGRQTHTAYGSQFTDIEDGDEIRESRYCGPII